MQKMELIRSSIAKFNWKKAFLNTSVNKMVAIFNKIVLNIFNNHILHETIVYNNRDPSWFNHKIRLLIKEKTTIYKYFCQTGKNA